MTEDEMVGWHHQLNEYGFEQTQGGGEGQGSLACSSSWVSESNMTFSGLTTKKISLGCLDFLDLAWIP